MRLVVDPPILSELPKGAFEKRYRRRRAAFEAGNNLDSGFPVGLAARRDSLRYTAGKS